MKETTRLTQLIFDQDSLEAHLFVGHDLTSYQYSTVIDGYANSGISEALAARLESLAISGYSVIVEIYPHKEVEEILTHYEETH